MSLSDFLKVISVVQNACESNTVENGNVSVSCSLIRNKQRTSILDSKFSYRNKNELEAKLSLG